MRWAIYCNGRDSTCSTKELQCAYLCYHTKLLISAHLGSDMWKMLTPAADVVGPVNPNLPRRCDSSRGLVTSPPRLVRTSLGKVRLLPATLDDVALIEGAMVTKTLEVVEVFGNFGQL